MDYARYAPMIADAARAPSLWRLLLGSLTVITVAMGWMVGVVGVAIWALPEVLAVFQGRDITPADTPQETLFFLLMIVGLGVGAWTAARFWHKRGLRSLMGRGARVLRHFVLAACVTFAMAAFVFALTFSIAEPLVPNLDLSVWLMWLPLALFAVALQTGAEELLFRGYLQSQLAARFRSPLLWLVFPSILFGFAHFGPGLPLSAALTYVAFAALFGLMAGDLTARTGSIGAAWGMHFANNTLAILVVAVQGSLTGLGLYRSGDIVTALSLCPLVILDLMALALVWLLIRRMLGN